MAGDRRLHHCYGITALLSCRHCFQVCNPASPKRQEPKLTSCTSTAMRLQWAESSSLCERRLVIQLDVSPTSWTTWVARLLYSPGTHFSSGAVAALISSRAALRRCLNPCTRRCVDLHQAVICIKLSAYTLPSLAGRVSRALPSGCHVPCQHLISREIQLTSSNIRTHANCTNQHLCVLEPSMRLCCTHSHCNNTIHAVLPASALRSIYTAHCACGHSAACYMLPRKRRHGLLCSRTRPHVPATATACAPIVPSVSLERPRVPYTCVRLLLCHRRAGLRCMASMAAC